MPIAKILLIDDETIVEKSIGNFLVKRDYAVTYMDSARQALALFRQNDFDLVISDIHMPGLDGLALLQELKSIAPETAVIMITGRGDMATAIEALRAGAADYLLKPINLQVLQFALQRALNISALRKENSNCKSRIAHIEATTSDPGRLIGDSPTMRQVRKLLAKVAASADTTVLITGESGTGKELAARTIHDLGARREQPFISANCMVFTPSLGESGLFGHEKGAFTGADTMKKGLIELADTGTLFLDEIGDMPVELQGQFLRVMEEKQIRRVGGQKTVPVDVRYLAATNKDLARLVEQGKFRESLFYRLNVLTIALPPLRDHRADIPLLLAHYLSLIAMRLRKKVTGISAEAQRQLLAYGYPGNVRELKNMVEQAIILAENEVLAVEDFPALLLRDQQKIAVPPRPATAGLRQIEAEAISKALAECGGNVKKSARQLKVGYDALRYRLKQLPRPGSGSSTT